MTLQDLMEQHQNIRFFEIEETNSPKYRFHLKELDDLFAISKNVAYKVIDVDSDTATSMAMDMVIQSYIEKRQMLSGYDPDIADFKQYVFDHSGKLEKLCQRMGYQRILLYSMEYSAFHEIYISENTEPDWDGIDRELANLRKKFDEVKMEIANKRNREINELIDSYKTSYLDAKTKSQQREILQTIALQLKETFGLDPRSDYRATAVYIRSRYGV